MNRLIQENKNLSILLILILFLLLFAAYFYSVRPIKEDVTSAENQVQQLQTDIQILEAQLAQKEKVEKEVSEDLYQLRKKMPEDRYLDQLILSLQEIEMVTESRIESISFNTYDGSLSEADQIIESTTTEEVVDEDEELEESETETEETISDEPPVSDIVEDSNLPENIRLLTLDLTVISPNFEHSQSFLKELENLERITRVDTLSFSKPGEEELLQEDEEEIEITMNVQITTFYFVENPEEVTQ